MRSWRQFPALSLVVCFLALCGLSGTAASAAAGAGPDNGEASWALTAGDAARISVTLQVPAPTVREAELLGETFAEISLPGTEAAGVPGQPALPVLGRFVAVPAGMTVRLVAARAPEQVLDGAWRPLPAQPVSAADAPATWDRAWYAQKAAATRAPLAEVGEPAVMHGVRVVPVTVRPVSWNRATGQVAWTPSVELDLELVPATDAAAPVRADRPLPASFVTLLEQSVLGFDKASATTVPLGTWVCIAPNDPAVLTAVEPLVAWRARQGYNVVSVTTAETGTSTTAIKAWLQNQYNTLSIPLEMVCLVGDANGTVATATWSESLSGYNGEGDHPYTQLDGTDILPDVHIGRLSASSAAELTTIVNKIVGYESSPWLTNDTNWFRRAGLTGDPSTSGYSCIWTNQWVKDQLLHLNYATIDTFWSGNFATLMTANVSAGESIFTYRGYYGMSGLTTGHISTMSNGQKLPYAIIMTCGTGSFAQDANCRSEAFLRRANGGAVAAIGTATIGTHTRYNNCIFAGVADGVLNTGDQRTGPSLSHGKLNMYLNYNANEASEVAIWSTWNNLMGDPATSIWTAVPIDLAVTAPAALDDNANALPALVTAGGSPVEGALVALYRKGVISVSALTGADGRVVLPVSGLVDGTYQLTVTGTNLKPWLGVATVGPQAVSLAPGALIVDDDASGASQGDGDGLAEPGETVELMIGLANGGTGTATGVTAQLSSPDALAVVAQAAAGYGSILSGATGVQDAPFVLQIDAGMRGGNGVPLQLVGTAAGIDYTGLVDFKVNGPALTLTASLLGGVGGTLNPGQTGTLRITVRNDGNAATAGATAVLSSTDPWVTAADTDGTLPAIAVGGLGDNSGNLFSLQVSSDCLPGHLTVLNVDVTFAEGGKAQVAVPVTFGTRTVTDPVGPDAGGYYAFDNGDLGYGQAPVYEWVEIDPALGGPGQSVGLTDFAIYSDDTRVVDLPFPFTYYGRDFSKISICSNGWLAMGATYQRHYRNRALPAVEAPEDMVCVYWDELYAVSGDGGVFTWYDAVNHRFIIEWRRMRNEVGQAIETFQAALYDPAHQAGDGLILMQYQTVNQVDSLEGYSTVGIQSISQDSALQYSYWNAYSGGAAALAAGRAIMFRTYAPQAMGAVAGNVTNASAGGAPITGATVSILGSGRNAITSGGLFERSVPIGTWDVAVSHPSFAPDTTYGVVISEGATSTVDFALVDVAGPAFTGTAVPASTSDTEGPYVVTTNVTDFSGVASMRFFYTSSTTGGPFELPLTTTGQPDQFQAAIPGQAAGTRVQFWLEGADVVGNLSLEPTGGPFAPHGFVVATVTDLVSADMETAAGWTGGAPGDNATSGTWTRVDPNAVYLDTEQVQPEDDHSPAGTICWVTGDDPAGSAQGAADVDGGTTTLLSPVFDVSQLSGLEVRFWRWFTNDTGNSPGQDNWIVQGSFDGGAWFTLENTTASLRAWTEMAFQLETYAPELGDNLQLRFVANDFSPGSVVEAAVDDFQLRGYAVPTDAAAPTVTMGYPNGGETLAAGAPVTVAWSHDDDIGVVQARIWLSTDSGGSWSQLAQGAFNQSWGWTVPAGAGTHCRVRVQVLDSAGNLTQTESAADFAVGGASPVDGGLPTRTLTLTQNAPNPFNPRTKISFVLPAAGEATLCVYDVDGRLVRTLLSGHQEAGERTVTWDGDDDRGGRVASGLYFCLLRSGDHSIVRKMTLLK
ncbi:MAG: carboxypeptidase regulatory-like domain-containing protein [bacterium]|nr:carboxypeptidase regulatory-like domain-containing protein [bacterium]